MEAQNYSRRKTLFSSLLLLSVSFISYTTVSGTAVRDSIVKSATINVSCNGGANGSATVGVKGGTSPYTYTWSPNVSSSATATGLSAGTYSISVQDANAISGTTALVTITQPAVLRDSIATNTGVGCNGGNGGSAKAGVKGGAAPYTYLWSTGSTLATASGLSAGNYSVKVTDKNGCNNTVYATITQPAAIRDSLAILTNPACNGEDASATIGIKGGTLPYTFTWTRGLSTSATASNLAAGSYTVTIKDAHNCSGTTVTFTVTQPVAIRDSSVTADKINVSCNGGNNGSITVAGKYGTPPYTYTWAPNVTSAATAYGLSAGVYSVTITDKNGCNSSAASITITQPGALRDSISSQVNIGCNGGNGGSATIGVKYGKAPYTYSWAPISNSTYIASGLTAATYTVTVTDNNGCNSSLAITITQPGALRDSVATISYPACNGSYGSATIGVLYGTPPYSYTWTGGTSTTASATNLVAGNYTVTVKDAHSCSQIVTFTITQPPILDVALASTTNPLCYGGTGSAIVNPATGGTSPYTYIWTPNQVTGLSVSGLSGGSYTIVVIDNNGCTDSKQVTITAPLYGIRDSVLSIINPLCYYGEGKVTLGIKYGTAPYTYSWTNNNMSGPYTYAQPCEPPSGVNTIIITDNKGCTASTGVNLNAPAPLSLNIAVTSFISCNPASSGSALALTQGGTAPYTYQWSDANATTTANVSNLSAGTYTVYLTDNNGCTASNSVNITITPIIDSITSFSCSGNLVTASVGTRGGAPPYTYLWSPGGETGQQVTGLNPGDYLITVTDADGCTNNIDVNLVCSDIRPHDKSDNTTNQGTGDMREISLYPSPTTRLFTITGLEQGQTVEMYDYTGRKLNSQLTIDNSQLTVNISAEPKGVYLIRVLDKSGNPVSQKKIVKAQ